MLKIYLKMRLFYPQKKMVRFLHYRVFSIENPIYRLRISIKMVYVIAIWLIGYIQFGIISIENRF